MVERKKWEEMLGRAMRRGSAIALAVVLLGRFASDAERLSNGGVAAVVAVALSVFGAGVVLERRGQFKKSATPPG